jgi:hypothetical protein
MKSALKTVSSQKEEPLMSHDRTTALAWQPVVVDTRAADIGLDPRALFSGEVPLLVLRGVFSDEQLARVNAAIDRWRTSAERKEFANGTLTTIGPWLMKYLDNLPGYFATAHVTTTVFESEGVADPGPRIRETVRRALGLDRVGVPTGPDGRRFADKVVRLHAPGVDNPLHNDKVGRDTTESGLEVASIRRQLSAVLSVQECRGGRLTIWRKVWEPADEVHKRKGALGYYDAVVAGCESIEFAPRRGDLYLFCPELYHAISMVADGPERRTIGQFIGFRDDNALNEALVWA